MSNALTSPRVSTVLNRLFSAAERDEELPVSPMVASGAWAKASSRARADELADVYMPISPKCGELLYTLVRASRPATIVEFGLSYGISAIHLAAGLEDNGRGKVISTELSEHKIAAAKANLSESGLESRVEILAGDALETLAQLKGPIDLVLLDGWKDLCLPVLKLLEPQLEGGALIVADDTKQTSMAAYLAYVRDPKHGYVSTAFPVDDGMEISCKA